MTCNKSYLKHSEYVHSRHSKRLLGLLCKLDFVKAYDRVDWCFLLYLLRRMGFGSKWRKWIQECILSAHYSILINGAPKGYFPAQRGLRQGDPLSPFLFVIVGEALTIMVVAADEVGLINGFRTAENTPVITHLQFADDTDIL